MANKSRRGRGEGAVYELPDGTWKAEISLGVDANGKRVRKSAYAATKRECLEALDRIRFEAGRGYADADRLTLSDYLRKWLKDTVAPSVRPLTYRSYALAVDRYIAPLIGGTKLSELRPTSMDGFQAAMKRAGAPAPSARYACVVLKLAIRSAAAKEVLPRNPFVDVRLAKPPRAEMKTWTVEEAQRFLAYTESIDHPLHAFFMIAVFCGLRHGELLALRWSDFDFAAKTLTVRHTLEETHGAGKAQFNPNAPVKTRAGFRKFSVPAPVIKAVTRLKARALALGPLADGTPRKLNREFLFSTVQDTFFSKSRVLGKFVALCEKAGVPVIRIHDLRHTCATIARRMGRELDEVKHQLGHSDIAVTNIYAHITPELSSEFADAMDTALRGRKS